MEVLIYIYLYLCVYICTCGHIHVHSISINGVLITIMSLVPDIPLILPFLQFHCLTLMLFMEKLQYHSNKFPFLPEVVLSWLQPRTVTNSYNSFTNNNNKIGNNLNQQF